MNYILFGIWIAVVLFLLFIEMRNKYLNWKAYKQIEKVLHGQELDEKEMYTLTQFRDYLDKVELERILKE